MSDEHNSHPADREALAHRLGARRPLVGMVHLLPLPGSPGWGGSMDQVLDRARSDARALLEGGMDALLVENYGDLPFHPDTVPPETAATLTRAVAAVREEAGDAPVGVNVLRNDARTGVGIAAATGTDFLRVNVHAGVMFTDQGILEGRAWETLRARRALAPELLIAADVLVKHASPPPGTDPAQAARDLRHRAGADVLVVSGAGTGQAADPERLRTVREAVPEAPLWIGSGLTPESAPELLPLADGAIVGSALHRDGVAGRGIDPERVDRLVAAARAVRG
jgi:uncharacterized protein